MIIYNHNNKPPHEREVKGMTREEMIALTEEIQEKAEELMELVKKYNKEADEMGGRYEKELKGYYWKNEFKELEKALYKNTP